MIKVLGKEEYLKYIDLFKTMRGSITDVNYPIDCPWVYDNAKIMPNDVVLDVGCGNGGVGLFIAKEKKCKKLYGLDAFHYVKFEEKCTKHGIYNAKFLHASAENIPCPNEYFDVVISISALEHGITQHRMVNVVNLDAANRYARQIARVLKSGKRLIATVAVSTKNPNLYFKSEGDVVHAFTFETGMMLVDENSLTGWKWDSEEVKNKHKEIETLVSKGFPSLPDLGWLPVGVIVEKK